MSQKSSNKTKLRRSRYKVAMDADENRRRREDRVNEIRHKRRTKILFTKHGDGLHTGAKIGDLVEYFLKPPDNYASTASNISKLRSTTTVFCSTTAIHYQLQSKFGTQVAQSTKEFGNSPPPQPHPSQGVYFSNSKSPNHEALGHEENTCIERSSTSIQDRSGLTYQPSHQTFKLKSHVCSGTTPSRNLFHPVPFYTSIIDFWNKNDFIKGSGEFSFSLKRKRINTDLNFDELDYPEVKKRKIEKHNLVDSDKFRLNRLDLEESARGNLFKISKDTMDVSNQDDYGERATANEIVCVDLGKCKHKDSGRTGYEVKNLGRDIVVEVEHKDEEGDTLAYCYGNYILAA